MAQCASETMINSLTKNKVNYSALSFPNFIEKVKAGDERAKTFYDFREKRFSQIPEVKKVLKDAEKIKAKNL